MKLATMGSKMLDCRSPELRRAAAERERECTSAEHVCVRRFYCQRQNRRIELKVISVNYFKEEAAEFVKCIAKVEFRGES